MFHVQQCKGHELASIRHSVDPSQSAVGAGALACWPQEPAAGVDTCPRVGRSWESARARAGVRCAGTAVDRFWHGGDECLRFEKPCHDATCRSGATPPQKISSFLRYLILDPVFSGWGRVSTFSAGDSFELRGQIPPIFGAGAYCPHQIDQTTQTGQDFSMAKKDHKKKGLSKPNEKQAGDQLPPTDRPPGVPGSDLVDDTSAACPSFVHQVNAPEICEQCLFPIKDHGHIPPLSPPEQVAAAMERSRREADAIAAEIYPAFRPRRELADASARAEYLAAVGAEQVAARQVTDGPLIHQALPVFLGHIQDLPKTRTIKQGPASGHHYWDVNDITPTIRMAAAAAGIYPRVQIVEWNWKPHDNKISNSKLQAEVVIDLHLVATDGSEVVIQNVPGLAFGNGDKIVRQAITSALKCALELAAHIGVPADDAVEESRESRQRRAQAEADQQGRQNQQRGQSGQSKPPAAQGNQGPSKRAREIVDTGRSSNVFELAALRKDVQDELTGRDKEWALASLGAFKTKLDELEKAEANQ